MCGNHNAMAESIRADFLKLDQEQLIRKFHLAADERYLYIKILNTMYKVDRHDGIITEKDSEKKPPHYVMIAIYDLFTYHADEKECPPLFGVWRSVGELGGMLGEAHTKRLYNEEVLAPFAGKAEQLKKACAELGGKEADKAEVSFIIPVFDFFPVWLQFWDADDEFPAELKFRWDQNSESFLHFEIVFYLTAYLEELLTDKLS